MTRLPNLPGITACLLAGSLVSGLCYCNQNANPTELAQDYPNIASSRRDKQVTGPTSTVAKANPFRFSTKYQDDEKKFFYCGYRYYNASKGRWICRDPKQERGGENLYGFVKGCPIDRIDPYGRDVRRGNDLPCPCICQSVTVTYHPGKGQLGWYDYSVDAGIGQRYGSLVHVTWTVKGDKAKCHYYQDEKGSKITVDGTPKEGHDGNVWSHEYDDPMGVGPILPGQFEGTHTIEVHWSVTFRCVSELGFPGPNLPTITRHDEFDIPKTTFDIPPKK